MGTKQVDSVVDKTTNIDKEKINAEIKKKEAQKTKKEKTEAQKKLLKDTSMKTKKILEDFLADIKRKTEFQKEILLKKQESAAEKKAAREKKIRDLEEEKLKQLNAA